jgi:branched-chain amino acid transport system ATP-binding protein
MTATALATRGLNKNFGALKVTQDVRFDLPPGARYALIGPNGAGKTTFINLLTGVLAPDGGTIELDGNDITALPAPIRSTRCSPISRRWRP